MWAKPKVEPGTDKENATPLGKGGRSMLESAARALEEEDRRDDVSRYGLGDLGFVYNVTAMSDVCHSPSLSGTFGFFDRPNAYNLALDLSVRA